MEAHIHEDGTAHVHDVMTVEELERIEKQNIEEMYKAVKQATAINDARLGLLMELHKVEPDPIEMLDMKLNLLADLIFSRTGQLDRLTFEFAFQKRLQDHLNKIEQKVASMAAQES